MKWNQVWKPIYNAKKKNTWCMCMFFKYSYIFMFESFHIAVGLVWCVWGITFLWPTVPGSSPRPSDPGPIYFFTTPVPNYLFTDPNDGITFSRPPSIKNYLFTAPSNKSLPCLFYSFKQNSTYSLFENSFKQKVLSHINKSIAVWINWLFFIWCKLRVIFK